MTTNNPDERHAVSDERESAGSAGDGTPTGSDDTGGQTAVVMRPARPTGKRARRADNGDDTATATDTQGAVTKNGGTATKTAKKAERPGGRNPIAFVWTYLTQVVAELRKVIWPNRKQMVTYTAVVLLFLAFMVALIAGTDYGLARLISLVFG